MPIIGACEPPDGDRYKAVKAQLAEAFTRYDPEQLNATPAECVDELGPFQVVLMAWRSLPYEEQRAIWLWLGPEQLDQVEVGNLIGCRRRKVSAVISRGIDAIIRMVYARQDVSAR